MVFIEGLIIEEKKLKIKASGTPLMAKIDRWLHSRLKPHLHPNVQQVSPGLHLLDDLHSHVDVGTVWLHVETLDGVSRHA